MKKLTTYFSKGELTLWGSSAGLILVSFFLFDRVNFVTLVASLIGTTSLIFNAKGNPIGQALMIVFSLLYGLISYTFSYFGEMITYLGMTGPMALFALISWLRNPYKGTKEVAIAKMSNLQKWTMILLSVGVTAGFYFILKALGNASLFFSTVSVTTSFLAISSPFSVTLFVILLVRVAVFPLPAPAEIMRSAPSKPIASSCARVGENFILLILSSFGRLPYADSIRTHRRSFPLI